MVELQFDFWEFSQTSYARAEDPALLGLEGRNQYAGGDTRRFFCPHVKKASTPKGWPKVISFIKHNLIKQKDFASTT